MRLTPSAQRGKKKLWKHRHSDVLPVLLRSWKGTPRCWLVCVINGGVFFYILSQHINSARWCAAAGFSSSQVQDAEFISYTAQSFLTRFTLHFASHPAAGCNSSGCSLCNRKCVSVTTGSLHKVVAAQCSAARKIWHYLTLKAAQFPDLFVKTLKDKTILSSVCHCSHPLPMCLL